MHVPTIAAALLTVIASSPALAEQPIIVTQALETRRVSFADLDLATNAGVDTLYHRVSAAASVVCDDGPGLDFVRQIRERRCFDTAMTGASVQLGRAVADALERRSEHPLASGGQ